MPTEALATAAASTPRSPLCPAERSAAATEPATDQAYACHPQRHPPRPGGRGARRSGLLQRHRQATAHGEEVQRVPQRRVVDRHNHGQCGDHLCKARAW